MRPTMRCVYFALRRLAQEAEGVACCATFDALASECGVSNRQVGILIQGLIDLGAVHKRSEKRCYVPLDPDPTRRQHLATVALVEGVPLDRVARAALLLGGGRSIGDVCDRLEGSCVELERIHSRLRQAGYLA